MLKKLTVAALLLLAAAVALVPVVAPGPRATAEGSTAGPVASAATVGGDAAVVELRVWQNVYNAEQLWVSARPARAGAGPRWARFRFRSMLATAPTGAPATVRSPSAS